LGGNGLMVIDRLKPAGAALVLRHNRRVPGNMLAEMPRHQPSVRVITAANAVADEERNGLAAVEIVDVRRRRRPRHDSGHERDRNTGADQRCEASRNLILQYGLSAAKPIPSIVLVR